MERPLNSTAKMGGIVDLSKARCVPTATEFGPKRRDYFLRQVITHFEAHVIPGKKVLNIQ